tara:strand:+ start:3505 stop:4656 length:1152 start_codon:yes stop_codon:yes gene_type:complete
MKNINRFSKLEKKYVLKVLENSFSTSKSNYYVSKLENEFAKKYNTKFAISFCNGTATMHSALYAAGIKKNDEVIVTPLTMSSTSFVIKYLQAIPVYADVDLETFQILPEEIEKKITKKTKAIITVALYGGAPKLDLIKKIAKKHNLFLLEDNAETMFSKFKNKFVGNYGDAASFSFQSSKHLTSGEGGMIITNNAHLADKIRRFNSLGYANVGAKKSKISKIDIQDPYFDRHIDFGYNFRISDLCAAAVYGQLKRSNKLVQQRIQVAKLFDKILKNSTLLQPQKNYDNSTNSYWCYSVKILNDRISWHEFRDKFLKFGGDGVYAAWKLSYDEPYFKKILKKKNTCKNAEYLQSRILQFKTNYWNFNKAKKQAIILKKTVDFFK